MPCDTIAMVDLELVNADLTIMKAMLESRGNTVVISNNKQILNWYGSDGSGSYNRESGMIQSRQNLDWFKPAHSTELVKQKAKKYGWKFNQTKDGKIIVQK